MGAVRRAFSLLLLTSLAFCAKHETTATSTAPPASAPAPAAVATESTAPPPATASATAAPPAAGVATSDGDTPGVTLTVKELKRGSGGIVSMKFVINNASAKQLGFGYDFGDPDHSIADFASVGGIQLIDPVGKKKYFVARDSEGKCVCSRGMKDLAAGASVNAWAKFPAPPDDVQKISIIVPHFSPMDDVPLGN